VSYYPIHVSPVKTVYFVIPVSLFAKSSYTLTITSKVIIMKKVISYLFPLWAIIFSPFVSGTERFVDVIVVLNATDAPGDHASNRAKADGIARGLGFSANQTYGTALFGFAARIPEGRLRALEKDPRVAYVDADRHVSLPIPRTTGPRKCSNNPNAPGCGNDDQTSGDAPNGQVIPWGIARIGSESNSNDGAGIHVYVLDTGIDSNHEDLASNLGDGFATIECNASRKTCKKAWDDDNGHGTHVAGTIGAINNDTGVIGVASGAALHAVKVLNRSGSGNFSGVIAGIDWVAMQTREHGMPAVANMSLSGSGTMRGSCSPTGFTGSDAFHEALCNAKNAGVVFAVAAGNSGIDTENTVPGAYHDAVISVSATDATDNWPSWSNWGDDSSGWSDNQSAPVAISAPGVTVLSTQMGGGTTQKSGTSMASPHVAGAIALYLASNSQSQDNTAFANARDQLLSTAETTTGFDNSSGNVHQEGFLDSSGL
jgi:subtilisin